MAITPQAPNDEKTRPQEGVSEIIAASAPPGARPDHGEQMILSAFPLVRFLAARIYNRLPVYAPVELEDLLQAGFVGLVIAARNYNPRMAVPFPAYARFRIQGEMLDSLRSLDDLPREFRRWKKRVVAIRDRLTAQLHRAPTEEEVRRELESEEPRMRDRQLARVQTDLRPTPDCVWPREDRWDEEVACRSAAESTELRSQKELRRRLRLAIEALPERQRTVILLYYGVELSMKEIGNALGVNESRISQIHKDALRRLWKALRGAGINGNMELTRAGAGSNKSNRG